MLVGVWLASGLVSLALIGAALATIRSLRRRQDSVPSGPVPDGVGVGERIAIRGLYRRNGALGGESHNSLNPRFAIGADAIHFRIFRAASWPFHEIGQVDVRKGLWGSARVLFLAPGNSRLLAVTVADMDAAKALLDRLPRSLPMSAAAATLRDGSAAAATPGLPPYSGILR